MADRFDKFTERARKVLTLAQEEAQRLGHPYIGTEHILLGLVRYGDSVAGRVLAKLGVDLEKARAAVVAILGQGQPAASGEVGLTHEAKRSLELATDEARRLNHHYVGTEHLLLGLTREGGTGVKVLENLGLSASSVRSTIHEVLRSSEGSMPAGTPAIQGEGTFRGEGSFNLSPVHGAAGSPLSSSRFDRFTERAWKVMQLAQEEAQRFHHNYIGTEHILLGLVRQGDGVAARVLNNLGVELDKARSAVESIIGRSERKSTGEAGLTPRSKRVIELALDEARRLNHHYVGTEHLLLGLVREGNGIAAGVLESLGVSVEMVRAEVIRVLKDPGSTPGDEARRPEQGQALENPSPPGTLSLEMIQTLFDHSLWARDRLLAVIQGLDESALRQIPEGGAYGSIFDTLAHMAVSEWMWVQRCIGDSPMKLPRGEDFANLRVLTNWWNDAQATTQSFLISLRDADPGERVLEQEVTYTGPDGVARTRKVWHMLLQVTNHQTEHRSQIASMLGQMGHEVPPTDLVVYFSQKASK